MVIMPSVVKRGVSLRRRVPGVISYIAMRPSPFSGIGATFQSIISGIGSWVPFGGESGSVVRLGAMA
jgi:hypothetical protein